MNEFALGSLALGIWLAPMVLIWGFKSWDTEQPIAWVLFRTPTIAVSIRNESALPIRIQETPTFFLVGDRPCPHRDPEHDDPDGCPQCRDTDPWIPVGERQLRQLSIRIGREIIRRTLRMVKCGGFDDYMMDPDFRQYIRTQSEDPEAPFAELTTLGETILLRLDTEESER